MAVTINDIAELVRATKLKLPVAIEALEPDKKLSEQGIDSLDFTKLLFEVEAYFDLEIPDEDYDAGKWNTLNKIISNLNALGATH